MIVDTNVFISFERSGQPLSLAAFEPAEFVSISAITVSELLAGVYFANSEARRLKRSAFVDAVLATVQILDFNLGVARVHAEMGAALSRRGQPIGAHDLLIAATALYHGFPVLTDDVEEFSRVPGLQVVEFHA